MKNLRRGIVLSLGIPLLFASPANADTLASVLEKGKLVVGVKTDFVPWGMRDASGQIVGLEIDLIKDFARRIGEEAGKTIEVELVPVAASNRMEFLEQGRIDVLIATMADTPERRRLIGFVTPSYYSSGVSVFATEESGIDGWDSIEGKKLCGMQGAFYLREHGFGNGADVVTFKGVPEIENALFAGRCDGWLYDDSALVSRQVIEPEKWADYRIAAPVVSEVPWGIAVRKQDEAEPIAEAISEAVVDWHKSGMILELSQKWGIPETPWLIAMQEKCLAGDPVCAANQ
ncbi:transporter substrate-binding domain-containing protein [Paracoccus sp. MKU1]|uniref:transporter substrate-binding domain-containing protein n=1 Tax=Paracoccus sp. MKU1 TaxID=1745182 RepID=UPI0007190BCA|nr:transporter substrate-binding domain-containing protein [Paracoccus sp. MKU1]KRW96660.1 hypothetical protein AQY21_08010 [Paracoccus sp. MKU1]